MKRRCLPRRRWTWIGILLVPALAWGIILAIVPTDWARARLVNRLTRATGRSVQIGALRLGLMGDLRIQDLQIAEPASPTNPWLKVSEARIDVHLGQILCGHCEPKEVVIDGAWLRVWRKPDGTPELGDLLRDRSVLAESGTSGASSEVPLESVVLKISGANVQIIDDPSGTRLNLSNVEIRATWGHRLVSIDELRGGLNGGTIAMAAKLDRDPITPRFQAEVRTRSVEIDRGMPVLGCFVPVVAGATEGVGGKFDLLLALKGQGTSRSSIRRTLNGHGSVVLDPIDLEGSNFLAQLDVLGEWPKETRIGSVASDFRVEDGRITTDDLTIRVSKFPFVLGGWTDFDGRFDYAANVDRITDKLPREAKAWLPELKVNLDQLAGLRMHGSLDHVAVTVHGHPLTGDPDRTDDERLKFRDTARRIRDRFFR